jgi:hypothetical protein
MNLSLKRRGPAERPRAGDEPRPDGDPPDGGRGRGVRFVLLAFGTASLMTVAMAVAAARVTGRSVLGSSPARTAAGTSPSPSGGYPQAVPSGVGDQAQSTLAFFPGYPLLTRRGRR